MAREIKQENPYLSRLLKLIPSEIIAAYLAIVGFIPSTHPNANIILLVSSLGLLVLIPFYLRNIQHVTRWTQIIFTMIAFIVWVYTLGGPFKYYGLYDQTIGAVILVFWTLLIPLVTLKTNLK